MTIPLFSVCIPTYNREKELKRCLDSFVGQAAELNVPIYISDNNSSDATPYIIKNYQKLYPGIIFSARTERTVDMDLNMLNALCMSDAQYALWLGDDDVLNPGAVAVILENLKTKPDLCVLSLPDYPLKKEYNDLGVFFGDYGMIGLGASMHFSTLVVNVTEAKKVLNPTRYQGTLHLYAGVVLDYLAAKTQTGKVKIKTIPGLINLSRDKKRWLSKKGLIFLDCIPQWISLLPPFYGQNPVSKARIEEFYKQVYDPTRFIQLLNLRETPLKRYPLRRILARQGAPFGGGGEGRFPQSRVAVFWALCKAKYAFCKLISNFTWGKRKQRLREKAEKYKV